MLVVDKKKEALAFVFNLLATSAVRGERCPENEAITDALHKHALPTTFERPDGNGITTAPIQLALLRKIQIEIWGKNWRIVEIMEGEHRGRRTASCPNHHRLWKKIYGETQWAPFHK